MFNLLSVVNGAVVDKPTSDFTGNSAIVEITPASERFSFILLLIIAFLAGILTHMIYIKIKKYLKEDIEETEEDNTNNKNERE